MIVGYMPGLSFNNSASAIDRVTAGRTLPTCVVPASIQFGVGG